MKYFSWRVLPLVLVIIMAAFFMRGLTLNPHYLPSAQIGKTVPKFALRDLNNLQNQFTSKDLQGKISLLNIWASWCDSCIEEQTFLLRLAKSGIPIYGINYKDHNKKAYNWLQRFGNPYRIVGVDNDGAVAIDLGVYGTPETFLIDSAGVILYRYAGVLNEKIWEREFLPIIKKYENVSV